MFETYRRLSEPEGDAIDPRFQASRQFSAKNDAADRSRHVERRADDSVVIAIKRLGSRE